VVVSGQWRTLHPVRSGAGHSCRVLGRARVPLPRVRTLARARSGCRAGRDRVAVDQRRRARAVFNSDGAGVSNAMTYFILAWMVLAPILAAVVPAPREHPARPELAGHVGAGILITVALVVAFSVASLVLAPGS